MNKIIKPILIVIVVMITCWTILIAVDYIRFKNSATDIKPLITISKADDGMPYHDNTIYYGLGYSIQYYNIENTTAHGASFKLFNIIKVWGWEAQ